MKKLLIILGISCLLIIPAGKANALIYTGPVLTNDAVGWSDTGLSITALKNVTLESFLFNNQGAPDLIQLYDSASTTLLYSYSYSGGESQHFVDVSWDLNSGQTYKLLAHEESNGKWEAFRDANGDPKFPVSNDHIRLNGSVIKTSDYLLTPYWFNFTNITTEESNHSNVVPEPATILLFSFGLFGLFVKRRKRI